MTTPVGSAEKRSARFGAASANDFIDVRPKKSRRLLALGIGGLILVALFAAWVWQGPYQSWQDRKEVEKFLIVNDPGAMISTSEKLERQNLQENPEPVRLYLTSKSIRSGRLGVDDDGKAELAALREAARQGSDLAALELVKKRKTSANSNFKETSRLLDEILERVNLGVKVGDPTSLYTLAVMKSEGLGTALDLSGAVELATRAANDLPLGLQESLMRQAHEGKGIYDGQSNDDLAKSLGRRLLDQRYYVQINVCGLKGDFGVVELNVFSECHREWKRLAALAGNPLYFSDYAKSLILNDGDISEAFKWFRLAPDDTLDVYDRMLFSFLELTENEKIPQRLYKLLSMDKFSFTSYEFSDYNYGFLGLGDYLDRVENDFAGNGSLLKIAATYRALYNLQNSKTQQAWKYEDLRERKNIPRWRKMFESPRVVAAAEALSNAVQTGNGLSAALKQIDMLDLTGPARIQQAKPTPPEIVDKDYRAKSGPLGRQSASGGLSSFTVDNSQGDQDVVVRLYRDGKLPAVRSFIVKKGDTYVSEKIRAGNYVMRHRRIGSDTTYEADEVFRLVETPVEGGTQFSRMRVTIYKVADGNLRTKEVPPDQF